MYAFLSPIITIGLFFLGQVFKKEEKYMKTIDFLKELHNAKEVWFYFEDEPTKKELERDLEMDLSPYHGTVRFDNTFQTWCEVSEKLQYLYFACYPENIFGGVVFVDYKKYLNKEPYIVKYGRKNTKFIYRH